MTLEKLVAEGRRIQRDCYFLKPHGAGEPVAMWFDPDLDDESITGWQRWLTARADALPNTKAPATVFFSLYTHGSQDGLIDFVDGWPPRQQGTPLYAHVASVLPPIEAVFTTGSEEIREWLITEGWDGGVGGGWFPEGEITRAYNEIWRAEHPIFLNDPEIYVATGGWQLSWPEGDWFELFPAKLLLTTIRNSEPWVELFQMPNGSYRVCQRAT